MLWLRAVEALTAIVYATPCPICLTGGWGGRLCDRCFASLPRLAGRPACAVCQEPFATGTAGVSRRPVRCAACVGGRAFACIRTLGPFTGELRRLLLDVKYRGRHALGYSLGLASGRELATELGPVDCVIPILLGRGRERERGANQAAVIASGVARGLGRPLRPHALRRIRETAPQTALSRSQRQLNLRGAFAAVDPLPGLDVLLVDDVVTTGATVQAAARAARAGGARRVTVLAIGRALLDRAPAADDEAAAVGPSGSAATSATAAT